MLHWFWNLFKKREEIYLPKERMIFSYFNGERIVRADPLPLYKRVMDKGPSLSIDTAVANSQSKGAAKAQSDLVKNVREIFALKPLTNDVECDGTLTDIETLNLLDRFLEYTENVKKNSRISQTTSTVLADSRIISKEDQITSSTSDFGLTDSVSTIDVQESSPTVQPSH